jgi:integral membrane protein
MSGALARYRVMAFLVGVGLIVLVFIGIPLQYGASNPHVVAVVGPIHGFLYLIYLASAFDIARRARFSLGQLVLMVAAGLLPFLAFVMEHKVTARIKSDMAESAA